MPDKINIIKIIHKEIDLKLNIKREEDSVQKINLKKLSIHSINLILSNIQHLSKSDFYILFSIFLRCILIIYYHCYENNIITLYT